MRTLLLLITFLLCSAPGHAQATPTGKDKPLMRILTAGPRALGRSAKNMVTFRNPGLALAQWATLGASIFDERTTWDGVRRCPNCTELGFMNPYRRVRTPGEFAANVIFRYVIETPMEQYSYEVVKDDSRWFYRHGYLLTTGVYVGAHTAAGISNMGIR